MARMVIWNNLGRLKWELQTSIDNNVEYSFVAKPLSYLGLATSVTSIAAKLRWGTAAGLTAWVAGDFVSSGVENTLKEAAGLRARIAQLQAQQDGTCRAPSSGGR